MTSPELLAKAEARPPAGWLWLVWAAVATLVFARPLVALYHHANASDLLSYIPLVPVVSVVLLFWRRGDLPADRRRSIGWALTLAAVGIAAGVISASWSGRLGVNDTLVFSTLAYVAVVVAGGFLFLGSRWMSAAAFPMAFLFFMVPLPDVAIHAIEVVSVAASAEVSEWLFRLTGTPLVREGTRFVIPGIVLEIARECSGINSSWTLFIVGLVAANTFLTHTWTRVAIVTIILPLAIIRNSIRILTIGLLCVHISPQMIDSYLHRRGGPIFFALSLVPLGLALWGLRRAER